ncbi:MAG: Na+/H+ antiporter subunit E [Haloferacaceae archaeon]
MSQSSTPGARVLVVVGEREAVPTVERGLREARDARADLEEPVTVDVVLVADGDVRTRVEAAVAAFDAEGVTAACDAVSLPAGDPAARTDALLARVGDAPVSRCLVGPGVDLSAERLRERFGPAAVELAPAAVAGERRRLLHSGGWRRLATVFGLTYVFYLAVGGFAGGLDLLTGALSAGVVALSLSRVALREEPAFPRSAVRLARMAVFLPVLLWEVVKANVAIAYVILHPRLPVDPSVWTLETDTREGLERMVLANGITLTPGTLALDVDGRTFTVHSLTPAARSDLEGGRLERLVAWVFHGRDGPPDGGETR